MEASLALDMLWLYFRVVTTQWYFVDLTWMGAAGSLSGEDLASLTAVDYLGLDVKRDTWQYFCSSFRNDRVYSFAYLPVD